MPARDTPPAGAALTVREVATRYRVAKDRVRGWLRSGELRGLNVAAQGARPRFVVTAAALAEFEDRHQVGPAPRSPRRRKKTSAIDFFPD
jgi:hypothetical protein